MNEQRNNGRRDKRDATHSERGGNRRINQDQINQAIAPFVTSEHLFSSAFLRKTIKRQPQLNQTPTAAPSPLVLASALNAPPATPWLLAPDS